MGNSKSELISYMKQLAQMGSGKQNEFWQWKADKAKLLTHVKTDEIREQYPEIDEYLKATHTRVVQKECYKNAGQLAINCEGVDYVEGEILYHGIPIEHAWNKIDGKYFDITKDVLFAKNSDYAEYVAIIELDVKEYSHFLFKYKHWGGFVFEQFLKEHPKMEESFYPKLIEGVTDKAKEDMFGVIDPDTEFNQKYSAMQTVEESDKDKVVYRYNFKGPEAIIKNPTNLDKFEESVRGVIDKDGNLYMQNVVAGTHTDLTEILYELELFKPLDRWWVRLPDEFITVQRLYDTDYVIVGESNEVLYDYNYVKGERGSVLKLNRAKSKEEAEAEFKKFTDAAQEKNPGIKFLPQMRREVDPALYESSAMDKYYEKNFAIPFGYDKEVVNSYNVVAKVGKYKTPIILNPRSLDGFDAGVRALADKEGNLYVALKQKYFNHGTMANALIDAKVIDTVRYNEGADKISEVAGVYNDQKNFFLLERFDDEWTFIQSDTFEWEGIYSERILDNLKHKNPQFKYDIDFQNDDEDDDLYNEEEIEENELDESTLNESPDDFTYNEIYYGSQEGPGETYAFEVIVNRDEHEIVDVLISDEPNGYHGDDYITNGPLTGRDGSNVNHKETLPPYAFNWKKAYPGRLFMEPKVITFWVYPNEKELKRIISIMEKKLNMDIIDNGWVIEIYKEGFAEKGEQFYGNNYNRDSEKKEFVPVERFAGSKKPPEKEYLQHLDTKHKHVVPFGYGSKNPKYMDKRRWQMANIADEGKEESYYPRLD